MAMLGRPVQTERSLSDDELRGFRVMALWFKWEVNRTLKAVVPLIKGCNARGQLYAPSIANYGLYGVALHVALDRLWQEGRIVRMPARGRRGQGFKLKGTRAPKRGWKVGSF